MSNPFPPETKLPNHLAIIPDGNRRWAKLHQLPSLKGHEKGFEVLLGMARAARDWGIHTTTIWIFSTENWKRNKIEVDYLMKIEEEMLKKHLPELKRDKVRVIHLGRKDRIPASFARTLKNAEQETLKNANHVLNIAVDYGGRDEILRGIEKYFLICHPEQREGSLANASSANKLRDSSVSPQNDILTKKNFSEFLDTGNQPYPNPDLLIRTSGEMRTSGLMPWQMVYTEFVFIKKHLPDCTTDDLKEAILEYSRRKRRFGGNG